MLAAQEGKYSSAVGRWSGVGPYYAMFPVAFASDVIREYTRRGDVVLDPFAGRGTAVFSAATNGRRGIGIEINPVGWVYAQAKLRPAAAESVTERLVGLSKIAHQYRKAAQDAPPFFRWCYHRDVLEYLLAARASLDWRSRPVDWTTMAFVLINLHGKRSGSLSNQMRQTKAMSPAYAINWWRERSLRPPALDPLQFLLKRVAWRYAKGLPEIEESQVYLGDSTRVLRHVSRYWSAHPKPINLLLTSPPYYGITDYHYDQWLRLWLLGNRPTARRVGGLHKGKFENKQQYRQLLLDVFMLAKPLLRRSAVIYVRTDRRELTLSVTSEVLREVFPRHRCCYKSRPYTRPTQTNLFGYSEPSAGETDLIFTS
jgi:hypothetical protein